MRLTAFSILFVFNRKKSNLVIATILLPVCIDITDAVRVVGNMTPTSPKVEYGPSTVNSRKREPTMTGAEDEGENDKGEEV